MNRISIDNSLERIELIMGLWEFKTIELEYKI